MEIQNRVGRHDVTLLSFAHFHVGFRDNCDKDRKLDIVIFEIASVPARHNFYVHDKMRIYFYYSIRNIDIPIAVFKFKQFMSYIKSLLLILTNITNIKH